MPANLSTSNRMFFVKLEEIEEDDLLIQEMSGTESVSQLFEFRLRLISARQDIDVRDIIGKSAILRIETPDIDHMGGERHWNGYVTRFARSGRAPSTEDDPLYTYECDIVPWFWFMTQHEDCRIFQNKTVREIIETIFGEFNYSDFKMELNEDHPTLEYCTQYHETSFDFISRLIEREGIHYYFRHNEDDDGETKHILVFTDNNDNNPKLDPDEYPFHHEGHSHGLDAISKLTLEQQMRTRKITLGDWDFKQKRPVRENTPTVITIGQDRDLERYRYPGGFVESTDGQHLSRMIMEAEEASHLRLRGESQIRTLAPGHTFTLYDHTFDAFNIEYMILSVWHHGRNNLTGDGPSDYGNGFTVHPHAVTYRAPLNTPKGLVRGPQTALVTGPSGEEIYTDEHGRIKVQFHWDRQGQYDDKTSCWIRVAQVWAGNGYGTLFIPRIGMEVVVDFLEGDPDQPLVTGCVYNGINKPPCDLPANATRSTMKTLSSKGGGGFNELRFEDKKDEEEIFLHAQKDLQTRVTEKATSFIGKDMHALVEENRYEQTTLDHHQTTKGKRFAYVEGDEHLKVTGDLKLQAERGSMNLDCASDFLAKSGMNAHIKGGTSVVLEAGLSISLKAGSNFINISPAGVSIVGTMVMINSGGSAQSATAPDKPEKATEPEEAIKSDPGEVIDPIQQLQAQALINAAQQGQPFCAECAAARAAYEALMA